MKELNFHDVVVLEDGPERHAALAAWLQELVPPPDQTPILVGGAAVELYTGGAYRTGDLDFVGKLPPAARAQLEAVGFRRSRRHWLHEEHQIFLEFPATHLAEGERAAVIEIGEHSVLLIGLEELLVDRLAAWQSWRSTVDAGNALLLRQTRTVDLDSDRLERLAVARGVEVALRGLEAFVERLGGREATAEEVVQWAEQDLKQG